MLVFLSLLKLASPKIIKIKSYRYLLFQFIRYYAVGVWNYLIFKGDKSIKIYHYLRFSSFYERLKSIDLFGKD